MRNQPKYNFFKNTSYALKGLVDLIKTETSFKIELIITLVLLPVIIFIDTTLTNKALMFITLMGMILAETTNSAIVFLSIFIFVITWLIILIDILQTLSRNCQLT